MMFVGILIFLGVFIACLLFGIFYVDFIMSERSGLKKKIKESKFYDVVPGVAFSACLAFLTMFLTPIINKRFEQQKVGSEYLLSILNNVKTDTLNLYMNVRELNETSESVADIIKKIKQDILKLRYRATEIEALIGKNDILKDFLSSLDCIDKNLEKDKEQRFLCLISFTQASQTINISLAEKSHIRPEAKTR